MKRIMMAFVCLMTMAVSANAQYNESIRVKTITKIDSIEWKTIHFQNHIYGIGLPEPQWHGYSWFINVNGESLHCPFCRQEQDDLGYDGYAILVRERQKCKEYRDFKRAIEKNNRKREREIAEERRMKYEKYLSLSNGTREPKSSIDELYR